MASDRVDDLLAASPLQRIAARRARHRLAVLAYHGVEDPVAFGRQLDHLVEHRRPVDLNEATAIAEGRLPARGAALVTFDDGHRSVLERGLPELAARGIPAVVFVVAGLVDSDEPFWWDEVERLSSAGATTTIVDAPPGRPVVDALKRVTDVARREAITQLRESADGPAPRTPQLTRDDLRRLVDGGVAVGNHSFSHPLLDRCDDVSISQEIAESHRALTDATGTEPTAFAYPNGDEDDRVVAAVRAAGYRIAFRFDHRLSPVPAPDVLRVSRLRVDPRNTDARHATIVSGLHPAIHHLRRRR